MSLLAYVPRYVFLPSSRTFATLAKNPLPASFLRGGTSKGIYINKAELLRDTSDWKSIFLRIMGSPDSSGRQLNGMGGGISSLNKICVVGPPTVANADVDYTFAQVGIQDDSVDYAGNCGNLSSMIGVFALDQGLVGPFTSSSSATVRAYNTNTRKIIRTTFPLLDSGVADLERPDLPIAGIQRKGSAITMEFLDPAGAGTGALLPSGSSYDQLRVGRDSICMSLVDATNPTVFVEDAAFELFAQKDVAEYFRREGATLMGLDPMVDAQPKVAFIRQAEGDDADIEIRAYSMGVLHKAVPMTVALGLGVAANVQGTIAYGMMSTHNLDGIVRIKHPGGIVHVGANVEADGKVQSAKVLMTGRRLMEGSVYW